MEGADKKAEYRSLTISGGRLNVHRALQILQGQIPTPQVPLPQCEPAARSIHGVCPRAVPNCFRGLVPAWSCGATEPTSSQTLPEPCRHPPCLLPPRCAADTFTIQPNTRYSFTIVEAIFDAYTAASQQACSDRCAAAAP